MSRHNRARHASTHPAMPGSILTLPMPPFYPFTFSITASAAAISPNAAMTAAG